MPVPKNRIAGTLTCQLGAKTINIEGDWEYNLGRPKKEMLKGPDRVHGYKEEPQVPYISGNIRDTGNADADDILLLDNETVYLSLANGKTVVLEEAAYCADGKHTTGDALLEARFEGKRADELRSK
jgi:hypothetical protein